MSVRPARASDRDAVWELAREFATTYEPVRGLFDPAYDELLQTALHVAELDGVLCGYVVAHRHATLFANAPVMWVEELMVAPGARRLGVGRALMTAVEEIARTAGAAAYVALATRRAAPFYDALGYEPSATFFRKLLGPGR